ncbi:MAG: ZIP family metal transporter, partial [Patescibacteria group bacterium]
SSTGNYYNVWILSIVAGGFIYIAVADLIPELHKTKELNHSFMQVVAIIIGILAMLSLTFIE